MLYLKTLLVLLVILPVLGFATDSTENITFNDKAISADPELYDLALKVRSNLQLTPEEKSWLDTDPKVNVRVGDYAPFHFVADDIPQGLGIDYMRTICIVYGLDCNYVSGMNVADSMRSMTEPGGIAVQTVWQRNPEREKLAIFTRPYVSSPFVIFQRGDSPNILNIEDLSGKRVVVEKDYIIHHLLQKDFPDLQLIEVDFSSTALKQLATGQADAYVSNLMAGLYLSQELGLSNIVVAAPASFEPNRLEIAVRKDWPHLAALIIKVQEVMTREEHLQLRHRWLNIPISGFVNRHDLLLYGSIIAGLVILVILIAAIITIHRMRQQIVAREEAEGKLQISESRLREAMKGTETGLWEWNPQANEVYLDPVWFTMLGYKPDALPHSFETFEGLLHPDDKSAVLKMVAELLQESREQFDLECRMRSSDGNYRWIHSKGRLLSKDQQGKPLRLIGIHTDITERKKAEETLLESEAGFRRLVEQSPVSIQIHGLDGKLIKANAAFAKLYALNQESLDGVYEKYNLLDDAQARLIGVMPYIEKTYKGEDVIFPAYQYDGVDTLATLDISKPVSRKCWVQTYGFALKDERGKVNSVVFFSEDITERKKAEQAILNYQQRLKGLAGELTRTQETERRIIATQLHDDVGQSLALMRIQLAAALKQSIGRKLEGMLLEVSSSLRQAVDDTRNIISSLSSPTLNELGLSAAITEYLNDQVAQHYNLKTRFSDDEQPKPLDDDSKAILYRNVRELLINVVKHAQASNVSVRLQRVGGNINIVVEDDGVGLNRLKLVDRNELESFGLFSIQESMRDIGGEMTIENKDDAGVRVSLTAPLQEGKTKTV